MKRYLLCGLIAALAAGSASAALTEKFYAGTSVLSTGNWVKIGVEKTGVYEISYETLREMGFSDPSKVSLYGRGGRVLPESFVTNAGVPVLTDDLTAVKVLHEGDKLYFYGLGPEEIAFETSADYSTGGYFTRKSNNIYSRRGYYFLTDSQTPAKMTEKSYETSSAQKLTKGLSYVYHELDSAHNITHSGQLFWGESINLPGATKKYWDVETPGATGKGVMECVMYLIAEDDDRYSNANVIYGFDGGDIISHPYTDTSSLYISPNAETISEITIPGESGTVVAGVEGARDIMEAANIDYWVISYERGIPSGDEPGQKLMAFPDIAKGATWKLELNDAASYVVLDVTTVTDPQKLKLTQKGEVSVTGVRNAASKTPIVAIFDTSRPQLQISGYEKAYSAIENQNLHSYKNKGADFIIITAPKFKPYAEEIARLHREYDGIEVVVATTEECYNEFSGGTPDPMAYRSFARMLYFSDRKPKNMLLIGPLYGDFRGMQSEHNPFEGIIAYQSPAISRSRDAHNINDFYGMMSDKFRTDYYERNDVQIGVGIMPIKFESEAQIMVKKIEDYLKRDDHAYYLNLFTAVGGTGNEHTHDIQVRDIQDHLRIVDNQGTIVTPLAIDTYGNAEARKKFMNQINSGLNMFSYFGHGAEQFLGQDNKFFNAGDVFALRNNTLPIALFGGCLITNTDRGFRGLGETIVTSTPYGCIGSVVSARETWSSQNFAFFKQFFTCLHLEGSTSTSARRTNPVTIGEVYAAVKNYSTYNNELAYQYIGDPALVIPTVNRGISVEHGTLTPGEKCEISGKVTNSAGQTDTGFNGEVVIRLNEPEKVLGAGMLITGEDPKSLEYTYRDEQVGLTAAEVKNGVFTAQIHVPAMMSTFEGKDALLYFAAYDPSTKVGGAGSIAATVGKAQSESTESSDDAAPVIENLSFNADACSIDLTVSDDVALNMSTNPLNKGLFLYIDGAERTEAHFATPIMETERAAFSKNVFIDGLNYGEHSARLKVKDIAGNTTEKEIVFTYNPLQAKYIIEKDDENSSSSVISIRIVGPTPSKATLVVLSSAGQKVYSEEFEGDTVTLDHEKFAADGKGHYKAYIIENGTGMQKGHSDPIDIPVI